MHKNLEVSEPVVPARLRWSRSIWMLGASVAAILVIGWLLVPHRHAAAVVNRRPMSHLPASEAVSAATYERVRIAPESEIAKRLSLQVISPQHVSHPLLVATGSVVARMRRGDEPMEERWQFASTDITTAYASWLQARVDVEFNQKQLASTRELTHAQEARIKAVVARLEQVAPTGSVHRKDLLEAEANLVQVRLQGQKDLFAAESALRSATRTQSALERQLMQAGIEPVVLARARDDMVLISANVPEGKVALVEVGQSCQARFYGFPKEVYSAHVEELSSIVNPELRTLRVLFDLSDPTFHLRPGMFAEVGLGTNDRATFVVPASAVVHIGRKDYLFKQVEDQLEFAVCEVDLGEVHDEGVEIVKGLEVGDRIIGKEAILLKPVAVQSLLLKSDAS